ncbi:MAG: methyltransferase domain-containing protein [Candidatus Moraniibacteriota bacterium]
MNKIELIANNLACPRCRNKIELKKENCQKCGYKFQIKENVPVFLADETIYINKLNETNSTNPYSSKSLEIIKNNPDAKILDFGAGNPAKEELFDNILKMEFVHYKSTDIVSTEGNLPFGDDIFDFVISESVFEHVKDPFYYAKEIYRVLKPGGKVLIDTAFLQPVHADPYHYFNMTLEGLREVFKSFKEIDAGVESYQTASYTLNILLRTYRDLLSDDKIKREFEDKFLIDFNQFNQYIPQNKQYIMSAGVYFVGIK